MHTISPCLWYNQDALEAAQLYTNAFENGQIKEVTHYMANNQMPEGTVLTVLLTLCGQEFLCLNGGPVFRPNPSLSFFVNCESEGQFTALWDALAKDGTILMPQGEYPFSIKYGWLQDKYGVAWQISLTGTKQTIMPYFLFTGAAQGKAEEAINQYCSIFGGAKLLDIQLYGKDMVEPEGTVMHATFQLEGQTFMAADSAQAHNFAFDDGVSLCIDCKTQEEIDYFWEKLTAGGQEQPCGWLQDKYGVAWQVAPTHMAKWLNPNTPARAQRVYDAMMPMTKINLQVLQDAYDAE